MSTIYSLLGGEVLAGLEWPQTAWLPIGWVMGETEPHVFHHPAGYLEFVHVSVASSKRVRVITQAFSKSRNSTLLLTPHFADLSNFQGQLRFERWEELQNCIRKSMDFEKWRIPDPLQSVCYRWKGYERKYENGDLVFSTLEDNLKVYGLYFWLMISLNQFGKKDGSR